MDEDGVPLTRKDRKKVSPRRNDIFLPGSSASVEIKIISSYSAKCASQSNCLASMATSVVHDYRDVYVFGVRSPVIPLVLSNTGGLWIQTQHQATQSGFPSVTDLFSHLASLSRTGKFNIPRAKHRLALSLARSNLALESRHADLLLPKEKKSRRHR
jgi:hypothetical protein